MATKPVDWPGRAKRLYIESPKKLSVRQVADLKRFKGKAGCTLSNLTRKCKEEGWVDRRREHYQKVEDKALDRIATKQSYAVEEELNDTLLLLRLAKDNTIKCDMPVRFGEGVNAFVKLGDHRRKLEGNDPQGGGIFMTQDAVESIFGSK